jgi:HD-GYP domain-containing protein (c-di-GMP phosphodiesterase class II)
MLHTRDANFFNQRLESIIAILTRQVNVSADESLLALFYLSEKNPQLYSATHCLLVCLICVLTASTVLHWSESELDLLMRCALTMNIGMVDLQDGLSIQKGPTDISQIVLIREHSNLSSQILELFGVEDQDWLAIVRGHHTIVTDPLKSESTSDRLIGLLQRADIFSAKLSSRVSRDAQNSSLAMKSIYFDKQLKMDAMGAAIIKAVGIYRPGSFVKLASGEIALVIRRGDNTATPFVAAILNKDGIPISVAASRNTADKKYAVISSVPSATVHVTLNLERMLQLGSQ